MWVSLSFWVNCPPGAGRKSTVTNSNYNIFLNFSGDLNLMNHVWVQRAGLTHYHLWRYLVQLWIRLSPRVETDHQPQHHKKSQCAKGSLLWRARSTNPRLDPTPLTPAGPEPSPSARGGPYAVSKTPGTPGSVFMCSECSRAQEASH